MPSEQLDPLNELAARADAGQKLGMQAIEFVMNMAARQGLSLDLAGAATAMENAEVVDSLDPLAFAIEKRSREITAGILRQMGRAQGGA